MKINGGFGTLKKPTIDDPAKEIKKLRTVRKGADLKIGCSLFNVDIDLCRI